MKLRGNTRWSLRNPGKEVAEVVTLVVDVGQCHYLLENLVHMNLSIPKKKIKKINLFKKEFTAIMLGPVLATTMTLRMTAELASLDGGELVAAALSVGKQR